jgi:sugar-specific transcriptional regulator TrmB
MVNPEIEALLKHLGLTEYEAKAILALLSHGSLTADKVSSAAHIPLPRVYDTMKSLAERGLISVGRTRPQAFTAVDPKRFFALLKEDEQRKLNEKLHKIDSITPQFMGMIEKMPQVTVSELEPIAFIKRRINVGKSWIEVQDDAEREFMVFAGDLSWLDERIDSIKRTIKRGVRYRVMWTRPLQELAPFIRKALRIGVELRLMESDYLRENKLRALVCDTRKVYIIKKIQRAEADSKPGKSGSEEIADYSGILLNDPMIAEVFRNYFNELWTKAVPADKWLQRNK